MSKRRVHEVAKELEISSKDLIERLASIGVEVKSHSSTIEDDVVAQLTAPAKPKPGSAKKRPPKPKVPTKPAEPEIPEPPVAAEPEKVPVSSTKNIVSISHGVTVKEFAEKTGVAPTDVIKSLMSHGSMKSITQSMDDTEVAVVAEDLGIEVELVEPGTDEQPAKAEARSATMISRPPVVTVMGHVDHGKTTVLDRIREANVVAGEHGGITQHIGAYQVNREGSKITFIDTPGHEAFTSMRARGAQVTDIAILVVAADDGVMPQTLEAMDHARAAHVPVIVAVNKIDKPESDPTRVRTELAERGLQPQEWGGDVLFVDVSAKTGENMDDLLTGIVLVAEDLGLTAAGDGPAKGVVLEAHLDKGRGPVATVIVQHGILRQGDIVIAGASWARVRAMADEYGEPVTEADPSRPVAVLGWTSVPQAGDEVRIAGDERRARQLAQSRDAHRRAAELVANHPRVSLDQLLQQMDELNLIVRADQQGTLEAVTDALRKMDMAEVRINLVRRAVGAINEGDVTLAMASKAIVVGFNVRPDAKTRLIAEANGVEIRTYRVIYELLQEIEQAMKGMLAPDLVERVLGSAEVRDTFKIPRGFVAGCYVTHGEMLRNAQARLLRDSTVVYQGRISTLRRFKEDVRNVATNFECGITLENFTDIHVGDVIEAFEVREVART